MNGAELLAHTVVANDVSVCFANPGTTEMPIVTAMDRVEGVRSVLFLFEGGATGAADGYARITGNPAMTLLHLGPGLANGMANLHNARRAGTPIFNVIGDHATWHLDADPPLAMDIHAAAGTVSGWVQAVDHADAIGRQAAEAIHAARRGMSATLTVPHDFQLAHVEGREILTLPHHAGAIDAPAVQRGADLLRAGDRIALILGGRTMDGAGIRVLESILAVTGCDAFADYFTPTVERGAGLPHIPRVPYFPSAALETLGSYDGFVFIGARRPTAFFGWPGAPSYFTRDDQTHIYLTQAEQDDVAVLQALAQALDAPEHPRSSHGSNPSTPAFPHGPLDATGVGAVLAAVQPEGAIIVNEGITTGTGYLDQSRNAPPHTLLNLTGGAIGIGIPLATGAAIAAPDRRVINLQADGSAMYTLQALWTQAREGLDVTTLICANRRYNILGLELVRAGITEPGAATRAMVELDSPPIRWTELARGMGLPAIAVDTTEALALAIRRSLAEPGPHLIEMQMVA